MTLDLVSQAFQEMKARSGAADSEVRYAPGLQELVQATGLDALKLLGLVKYNTAQVGNLYSATVAWVWDPYVPGLSRITSTATRYDVLACFACAFGLDDPELWPLMPKDDPCWQEGEASSPADCPEAPCSLPEFRP